MGRTSSNMNRHAQAVLVILFLILVFIWSAVRPYDYLTWALEVFPIILGAIILSLTYDRFKWTPLVYYLMAFHAVILMIGGHYTYARVPLFNWMKEILELQRNHYDRLGHFVQGFVPAMIIRELLIRTSSLKRGRWLFWLVISGCLAFSAFFELFEWFVAVLAGRRVEAFLGTQGDVWDTQWDMFLALIGAWVSLTVLSRYHDHQLKEKTI